ncbi:hypothetical protein KDN24_14490 [Bacillus sp. Bva_UNVM-123]|uniref:hypothetical protein n=1 Tax=Bacillus sp. Bva_UNVM-123 TaxID=2829798 RepID=UPI00391F7639
MAETKKFVLYEYLVFFWKKKVFFLIIPLIFALLGFGASYLVPKDGKYVGNATIFTGSIKLKALTNPSNIIAQFGTDINGEIDATVTSESYVKLKIYNDNKEQLEKDLEKMASAVEKSLLDNYGLRFEITTDQVKTAESKLEALHNVLNTAVDKLENGKLGIEETKDIVSTIEWTEMEIADTEARISRVKGDLAFFEKPSVNRQDVNVVSTYKTELTAAGLIFGVFAAFLILMLWKYVNEARRYNSHD